MYNDPLTPAQSAAETPVVAPEPRERSGSSLKVVLVILVLVVLGLIGFLIYHFVTVNHTEDDNSQTTSPDSSLVADAESYRQEQEVLTTLATLRVGMEEILGEEHSGFFMPYYNFYKGENVPVYYKPEGLSVNIVLDKAYSLVTSEPSESLEVLLSSEDAQKAIGQMFEKHGFTEMAAVTMASAGLPTRAFVNEVAGIVCYAPTIDADISCGYKGWYNREDAELSETLARVYKESTNEDVELLQSRVSAITNSIVEPYQRIQVLMPASVASFYRVNPESPWVFVFRGQMGMTCSEYNTDDLRKAFAGETCNPDDPMGSLGTVQP